MGTRVWLGRAVLGAALLSPAVGAAQEAAPLPSPLSLDAVSRYAREHRAEITASRERTVAGWAAARSAGKPPDPMVMTNLDHLPLPEVMGADVSVMIQQSIPLSGELAARTRRAEWTARAWEVDEKTTRLDVEREAAEAYLMLAEDQAMRALVVRQIASVQALEKVVEAKMLTSSASAADLLRMTLERAKLELRRDSLDHQIKVSDAMLDAALGRAVDAAVPDCALPDAGSLPADLQPGDSAKRPELAAMGHRVRAADEEIEVMRHMRMPMGVFGLGVAYTMSDGLGLMATVGLSLPIWASDYDHAIDEAKAMASTERATLKAMTTMVDGTVVAASHRLDAARAREASLRTQLLPLSEQVSKALLTSYATSEGSVLAVIDGLQATQMIEMDHIASRAELGRARVAWARATGSGE